MFLFQSECPSFTTIQMNRSECPRKCVVGGEENCERDDKYNATSADHERCTLEYYQERLGSCIFTSTVPETPDRIHTP
ncbi:hypothetical protein ANN_26793 [Periplaneta americana]|uniref:ShKT domain-containing protein n=1 Tax=Periplaneta americana TaxID=6978 RepID=A0ABQ8RZC6_PERAM|nr:hypothetical protein ANN_26793 [Periplaneta americana]